LTTAYVTGNGFKRMSRATWLSGPDQALTADPDKHWRQLRLGRHFVLLLPLIEARPLLRVGMGMLCAGASRGRPAANQSARARSACACRKRRAVGGVDEQKSRTPQDTASPRADGQLKLHLPRTTPTRRRTQPCHGI
jgi:hypothetical protein